MLARHSSPQRYHLYLGGMTLCLIMTCPLLLNYPLSIYGLLTLACLWWLVMVYALVRYQQGANLSCSAAGQWLIGFGVLLSLWLALLSLHMQHPARWLLFLLLLIWTLDSLAYLVGTHYGRRQLASRISPKKTWEGLLGGIAGCILLTLAMAWWEGFSGVRLMFFVLLCATTVAMGVFGDLLESWYKRQVGAMHSSNLLPGHGGMLDRIDSLTAAAPVFVLGLTALLGQSA